MVNWKLCIDSPQQRALDFCYGSLTKGSGWGCGRPSANGDGYSWADGDGHGDYDDGTGDGWSEHEW